jgi:hypothetical protein
LPKTNPGLHAKITTGITKSITDDKSAFSIKKEADVGNGSDIPIEDV